MSNAIMRPAVREKLQKLSTAGSDALWQAGDIALQVVAGFREKKANDTAGDYASVTEYMVWQALGANYGGISGRRMQDIATVCGAFPTTKRNQPGDWSFGYYQRAMDLPENDWIPFFEYLELYRKGEISDIGRRLGVEEGVQKYRQDVMGVVIVDIDPAEPNTPKDATSLLPTGTDVPQRLVSARISIQEHISSIRSLRSVLSDFKGKSPKIDAFLAQSQAAEKMIPDIMRELGIIDEE